MVATIGLTKVKRSSFSTAVEQVYTCCCGAFHVKEGIQVLAAFFLLSACFLPVQFLIYKNDFYNNQSGLQFGAVMVIETTVALSQALCAALVFVALRQKKKKLLLPFLYSQYCAIALSIALSLVVIFDAQEWLAEMARYEDVSINAMIALSSLATVIHILVRYWIASIAKKCYQYLADMEKASKVERLPRF